MTTSQLASLSLNALLLGLRVSWIYAGRGLSLHYQSPDSTNRLQKYFMD